jgi:hypothetical protein
MSFFYAKNAETPRPWNNRACANLGSTAKSTEAGMARDNVSLTQLAVTQFLGEARLKRLLRAKWLVPQPKANEKVL